MIRELTRCPAGLSECWRSMCEHYRGAGPDDDGRCHHPAAELREHETA